MSQPRVRVERGGAHIIIRSDDVVCGDTLCLESGSALTCDCEILDGTVEVNESVLTGESEPVVKHSGDKLLSGSSIVSGKCRAEAVGVGDDSFAAKMVTEVKGMTHGGSEMLSAMKRVTKFTGFFIIPLGILLFAQGYFLRGEPLADTVVATSAGLLGMLPKGLVLLISIGFATGVIRLSKKNVLVRELHSLENLAHCDTVCLDKTGTLTEGKLTVESFAADIPEREFAKYMATYIKYTDDNNSTYIALKNKFESDNTFECTASLPFSSERKYSCVTLSDGRTLVIGAPEKFGAKVDPEVERLMDDGKRVIYVGLCRGDAQVVRTERIGMVVISDRIRKNAAETIGYFYTQGVDVKIISGDSARAAAAIAEKAGVRDAQMYINVSAVSDEMIDDIAEKYTVFGRVTPNRKKLLIAAVQKKNHKVAMTGDGVNDLLAMRRADCSVAMGNGSDAARQTAQLVLVDSDFAVLKDVISEGRRVINNLTKSAGVFFIKTIYSVLLCMFCLLTNSAFPFIPIQITLIDAVIEAFPAFFMSFERNDRKCESDFLGSALHAALPNGVAVFAACAALSLFSGVLGADRCSLLMYLSVGFISLAGVVRACLPLNPLRGFLAVASVCGFVCAVMMFPELLQLPPISL